MGLGPGREWGWARKVPISPVAESEARACSWTRGSSGLRTSVLGTLRVSGDWLVGPLSTDEFPEYGEIRLRCQEPDVLVGNLRYSATRLTATEDLIWRRAPIWRRDPDLIWCRGPRIAP